jgi:hypothetical protein
MWELGGGDGGNILLAKFGHWAKYGQLRNEFKGKRKGQSLS